jgi:ADP-ribose pyrophosphatase
MKITNSREIYKCGLFRVTEDEAVDARDGFAIKRAVVRHAGSAVMMAVDERKRILLVRQYRLPADAYLWELPAGRLDPGEKPLQAARRELAEETGYEGAAVEHLGTLAPDTGRMVNQLWCYHASGATPLRAAVEREPGVELVRMAPGELMRRISDGEINHALTLAVLMLAVVKGRLAVGA